jgi:bacteriorhodopsin
VSHAISGELAAVTSILSVAGLVLAVSGGYALRAELAGTFLHRRGEILLYTVGLVGIFVALAYLSMRFPMRFDLTTARGILAFGSDRANAQASRQTGACRVLQ